MTKQHSNPKDYLDRHDRMQRLNNRPVYVKQKRNSHTRLLKNDYDIVGFVAIVLVTIVFGAVLYNITKSSEDIQSIQACVQCHNYKMSLAKYFQRSGSRTPEEMANAVLKTKSPRLLAAVSVVASDGNPTVKRTGYKKRHYGAFQVNPKHRGKVPNDAVGQALQAEAIMEELVESRNIKEALNYYGGDKTKKNLC